MTRRELIRFVLAAPVTWAGPALAAQAVAKGKPPRVRITNLESFSLRVPPAERYQITRVHTDAGITGTSFIGCPQPVLENWVKPTLVGEDLFAVDRHLARLQMQRGEPGTQIWSGVEHAIWDAIGRVSEQPVARLLGGHRDRLRVYRTTVWPGKQDQSHVSYETQAEFAVRLKKAGYTAMKIRAWRPRPMDDVEAMRVIRAAAGPDFDVMFDRTAVRPGWVWDYRTALQVARGLEKYNARWLEEPFDGYDLQAPARLAAEVDIAITGGELGHSIHTFLAYLMNKTYDIVQPDTRICGGLWVARKISVLAEAFGVPCIQHGAAGPALAAYIQAGCSMPNCEFQEIIGEPNLPEEQWAPALKLLKTPYVFRVEKGYVLLPETQGIGLDLNEDALKEYRA
ncbi:MAG: mandelate racemase/muconate lactonizing enzyme family protein [Acidobacteria bacterium]|nr:mandelate racemase/muconate lactonizing enzyme family protein [Acidobacteriota bacterium]